VADCQQFIDFKSDFCFVIIATQSEFRRNAAACSAKCRCLFGGAPLLSRRSQAVIMAVWHGLFAGIVV